MQRKFDVKGIVEYDKNEFYPFNVVGPISLHQPEELNKAYYNFLSSNYNSIHLDFTKAGSDENCSSESFDTSVAARIVEFYKEAKKRGGEIEVHMKRKQAEILGLCRLDYILGECLILVE